MFITPEKLAFSGTSFLVTSIVRTAYMKQKYIMVPKKGSPFTTIGTDSATFYVDNDADTIVEVIQEYKFDDVRPSDIVLDVGACIGAFSLSVHKKVNSVYAVEPIMIEPLNKNIELNNAKNITVLDCALGDGPIRTVWKDKSEFRYGLSLQQIIDLCGGHVDFLKLDCEGGEWSITLPEIMNIRRIEAEIHDFDHAHRFEDFEKLLTSAGFDYTKIMTHRDAMIYRDTMIISAKNRYID